MSESKMDELCRSAYASSSAVKYYDRPDKRLFESEKLILAELMPEITGKKLLDIGIGGGRTTPFLRAISSDYTGIDYSPVLIERARARLGIESLYCCDARDLSRFEDNTFDFALFSFNGIDSVPHQDRLACLREIRRVLKDDAPFVFSSHNRGYRYTGRFFPRMNSEWSFSSLKALVRAVLLQPRHWWLKRFEFQSKDYAILNDSGLKYSLLNYYISIPSQTAQLNELGFGGVKAYDMRGRQVTEDEESVWIYYLARKTAAAAEYLRAAEG